ncbi:MAG: histidine kinase, partial [Herminiimonas sp.]|nr:histidine kinase [Herminiimonas sp.]
MAPWILVSASVGYLAGHALGNLLTGVRGNATGLQDSRALVVIMAVVFAVSIACVYFMYARSRMATMEAAAQATMRSAAENQLKMLQSQLEPHMLFNTLANLRVLIGLDPSRAQDMLDHIISFLRATLEASRAGSHPLSAEFARIADYLAMMQVRMGSRLHFEIDLPAALSSLMIPPLLLQPLVENAIKHGLEPKIAGGSIIVRARREGDMLTLSVRDTGDGPGLPTGSGTHFGLQHVRERIATVYGKTATLDMRDAGDAEGGTLVQVRIPATYPGFPTDEARR